jgi:acyl-[acyl-carrier-protein]-phospholipid O-acyltransferase / long-chain-fatty-acid--[acyl-carrier-protein] ligase
VGELCQKHAATIMMGTATFLRFYLRRCQPEQLKSLWLLICGAEKLPVKLAYEFQEKFGILPLEGYGCTETSPVVSVNLPDVEIRGVKQIANCMGTVGQPISGVVAKAFDPESFAPLPPTEEGMLGVKGPNVMLGYWKQPEKTSQVVRDGWYMTGDIGRIELDGFIRITGRVSRFAKSGGEMIPLEKLEEEMQEILGSGERMVTACAVPDDKRGERVVVLYLPEVAEKMDGILKELPTRGLPNLWLPSRKDCHEVAAFPTLGSGKLDLKAVGELAKQLAQVG